MKSVVEGVRVPEVDRTVEPEFELRVVARGWPLHRVWLLWAKRAQRDLRERK